MGLRFYYGWWIVIGAILCNFVSLSVGTSSIGVFTFPIVDDLGWKVWQYSLGPSIAIGAGALSSVLVGNILDQKGPKPLILLGSLVSAFCLGMLGIQSNLIVYLSLYFIAGFGGWNLFSSFVVNSVISKWFIVKRGWALAFGSAGISLGSLVTPVLLTGIVDSLGWRIGYFALCVLVVIVIIPVSFLMRRTPEDYGLLPDGVADKNQFDYANLPRSEMNPLNRSQAIKTQSFWLLVFGFTLISAGLTCVLIHAIPFTQMAGFTRVVGAIGISVNGFANLFSKTIWGYSMQKFHPRVLVMIAYSLSALGVGMMLLSNMFSFVPILMAGFFLYGFGFGGTIPLSGSIWARYFGRENIGSITGITQPVRIFGTAVAPVLISLWFDNTNEYGPGFMAVIVALLLGASLVFFSREPHIRDL